MLGVILRARMGALLVMALTVVGCTAPQSGAVPSGTPGATAAASAGAAEAIKIGAIYSVTGPISAPNQEILNGIRFAFQRINESGGIAGRQVQLVARDDRGDPSVGVAVYRDLAADPSIVAIAGPALGGVARLIAKEITQHQIPLVTFVQSVPDQEFDQNPYWYRMGWGASRTVEAVAQYLVKQTGAKRITLLYPNDSQGTAGRDALLPLQSSLGFTVTDQISYAKPVVNPTVEVLRAKNTNPDAYIVWEPAPADLGIVVRTLRQNGVAQKIGAPQAATSTSFIEAAGREVDGIFYWAAFANDDPAPGAQAQVAKAWRESTGTTPTDLVLGGYAVGQVLGAALERVLAQKKPLTRENINEVLNSLTVTTVYGELTYSKGNHGNPLRAVPIIEYKNGKATRAGSG